MTERSVGIKTKSVLLTSLPSTATINYKTCWRLIIQPPFITIALINKKGSYGKRENKKGKKKTVFKNLKKVPHPGEVLYVLEPPRGDFEPEPFLELLLASGFVIPQGQQGLSLPPAQWPNGS